jgi:hypothetical protein
MEKGVGIVFSLVEGRYMKLLMEWHVYIGFGTVSYCCEYEEIRHQSSLAFSRL